MKPASEHWILARKPLIGTVAANVLQHGTGALNIDACRVAGPRGTGHWSGDDGSDSTSKPGYDGGFTKGGRARAPQSDPAKRQGVVGRDLGFSSASAEQMHAAQAASIERMESMGRWPANVMLSHLPECRCVGTRKMTPMEGVRANPVGVQADGNIVFNKKPPGYRKGSYTDADGKETVAAYECAPGCPVAALDGQTNANTSRFFYVAKPSRRERNCGGVDCTHPTVKSFGLMRWLVRLIMPPGGLVLDPFTGSGTTGAAVLLEGGRFLGMEREPEYQELALARIGYVAAHPEEFQPAEPKEQKTT